MPSKARVVYRKSDGLCLQSPTRPPCLARPDMITDRRLIDRQIIPEHGGKPKDYVVVEFDRSSKQPPWDFKWKIFHHESPECCNWNRPKALSSPRSCRAVMAIIVTFNPVM